MGGWQTFWTWMLGLSVILFFLVEVVVVIGGAGDIKEMFAALRQQADNENEDA
jgi:hypothetical protein